MPPLNFFPLGFKSLYHETFCNFSQRVIKRVFNEHDPLVSGSARRFIQEKRVVWRAPWDPGPALKAGSAGDIRFTQRRLGRHQTEWNGD